MKEDLRYIIIHNNIFYFMNFEDVYYQYNRLCKSIAYKFINKFNTYEDLISISNYSIFKALKKYDYNKNVAFITYLSEVTKNDCLLNKRLEKKLCKESSLDIYYPLEKNSNLYSYSSVGNNEILYNYSSNEDIKVKINSLIPTLRKVVILHYYYGYYQNEIAKMFNVDRSTISRQLKRAYKIMRS
jgi:RNA polymerase sigma factor (sigma-70 family)